MFFIDYISFTIKYETDLQSNILGIFYEYFPIEIEEYENCKGLNGYAYGIKFASGLTICYGGRKTYNDNENMGIHIIMSGQVLANDHITFDVIEQIKKMRKDGHEVKISRLDIAIDTEMDFHYVYNEYLKKKYVCRYKKESIRQCVNEDLRGTLYFGKRGSNTMFRIYDKALEQGLPGNWLRIELEIRNEAIDEAIEALNKGIIGQYFEGHLRFVEKINKTNKSRSLTAEWWNAIMKSNGIRRTLKAKKGDATLEWFINQVAPAEKALRKDYGDECIDKIIEKAKISRKQVKNRFNLRVIRCDDNKYITVNLETGEIMEDKDKNVV